MPTRLVAGLAILKHSYNVSDEVLCESWLETLTTNIIAARISSAPLPLYRSSMTHWRNRMGEERLQALLQESLAVTTKTCAIRLVIAPRADRYRQRTGQAGGLQFCP
ncbi:transposase [Rhodopseudomonas palustris]|uniref:transposase n=1 Tax=Rhodopseudomonas palustris TaxID=1076 RepID=UPI00005D7EE1